MASWDRAILGTICVDLERRPMPADLQRARDAKCATVMVMAPSRTLQMTYIPVGKVSGGSWSSLAGIFSGWRALDLSMYSMASYRMGSTEGT